MLGIFGRQAPIEKKPAPQPLPKQAHIIVLGNEKGGSGKTTSSQHLIVALLRIGFKVGAIDIDSRQRSLARYLENREATMKREGVKLPMPEYHVVQRSVLPFQQEAEQDEAERFLKALFKLQANNDFVIVDSPGNDTFMSRLAHNFADTIITPINDSFVDLDVLAHVDGITGKVIKPSIYSEMVWEQKLKRAKRDSGAIDWIVMRNRLSNIHAKNKELMLTALDELSRRVGFRVAPGFGERVIFRELFLQGLTVLDIMDAGGKISMSHITARQEVRDLLKTLNIPKINEALGKTEAAAKEASDKPAESSPQEKPEPALPPKMAPTMEPEVLAAKTSAAQPSITVSPVASPVLSSQTPESAEQKQSPAFA